MTFEPASARDSGAEEWHIRSNTVAQARRSLNSSPVSSVNHVLSNVQEIFIVINLTLRGGHDRWRAVTACHSYHPRHHRSIIDLHVATQTALFQPLFRVAPPPRRRPHTAAQGVSAAAVLAARAEIFHPATGLRSHICASGDGWQSIDYRRADAGRQRDAVRRGAGSWLMLHAGRCVTHSAIPTVRTPRASWTSRKTTCRRPFTDGFTGSSASSRRLCTAVHVAALERTIVLRYCRAL